MATALELVALDLDGTLVDSAPDIAHGVGTALEAVGFARPSEALVRTWIGDGLETLIVRALAYGAREAGVHDDPARQSVAVAAFLECYAANLFVRSTLYPHTEAALDVLLTRGLRLCCVTNKAYGLSVPLLAEAGIADRFELVLGGDSLAEKKPSPLPLLVAAEQLGVQPAAAALVGDSHQDLRAARAAGFRFVHAAYGYGKVDAAEAATAPRIDSLAELEAALGLG